MQIHGLQQAGGLQSVTRPSAAKTTGPAQSTPAAHSRSTDQLDLSAEAKQISQSQAAGRSLGTEGVRTEKVAAIRQAIAAGTYETPENLSAALDKLLDTLA